METECHQVFISYSNPDQPSAIGICRALESAGIKCWMAPRDIASGSQWGGSIMEAIQSSKAVLVVFSQHANASPQVGREMEAAVAKRLPLIPVRLADVMPTEDMQYFLSVSQWFNAYPQPLRTFLPDIVKTTKRVLAGESRAWRRFSRRLPQGKFGQFAAVAVAIAAAIVIPIILRPSKDASTQGLHARMVGRWETELPDSYGHQEKCIFDVKETGPLLFASYSSSCPVPMATAEVGFETSTDGSLSPELFTSQDDGTFKVQNTSGAFRVRSKSLLLRTVRGQTEWIKINADQPIKNDLADIMPHNVDWPTAHVPEMSRKALVYVRAQWNRDAVLTSCKAEHQGSTKTQAISFSFYSAGLQLAITLQPGAVGGSFSDPNRADEREEGGLPPNFLDLPQAISALKTLHGKEIKAAEIGNWQNGEVQGGVELNGVGWFITSSQDESEFVPASLR
jgi:TIR domain-containing protein